MNGLREKFRNKKGFTLIEMLIVVAIIAILVAVSIPMINTALEKAKAATDAANERAAKAEAAIQYLTEGKTAGTYYYDAAKGTLESNFADIKQTYGKCTAHSTKNVLAVKIDSNGEISLAWVNATVTAWADDNTLHNGVVNG